jgi:hypothetical protein
VKCGSCGWLASAIGYCSSMTCFEGNQVLGDASLHVSLFEASAMDPEFLMGPSM